MEMVLSPSSGIHVTHAPEILLLPESTNKKEKKKKKKPDQEKKGWASLSLQESLTSLEQGLLPNPSVQDFACMLHKCRKQGNPQEQVLSLRNHIQNHGFQTNPSLGNRLVPMLVEIGGLSYAQNVFDGLSYQTKSSWNALISGYVKHGELQHALSLYRKSIQDNASIVCLTGPTFISLLKACANLSNSITCCELHDHIIRQGLLDSDYFLGSALVDALAKCGMLGKALEVFEKLPVRDVVSWNSLISGYSTHGYGANALDFFEQMQREGFIPTSVSYVCALNACGSTGDMCKGMEVHDEIAQKGLETCPHIGSALVDMYAKCGLFESAKKVIHRLQCRNIVSWTALIKGYIQHAYCEEALACFEKIQREGLTPDAIAFTSSLKACAHIEALDKGMGIHAEILRRGLDESNLISCALVDMYAKCGALRKAQEVFDRLLLRDVALWNALIAGYVDHECAEQALRCFEQMQDENIPPDAVTFITILKVCAYMADLEQGEKIHDEISRRGLDKDMVVGSALIDMYAECGSLTKAREVFDSLSAHDMVSWTVLIAGYAEHGHGEEALQCFQEMKDEGLSPSAVTIACTLKACASIGSLDKGERIHNEVVTNLEKELLISNALIDMYAKCGLCARAQEVFNKLEIRDVVSWNTLMSGYAQLGDCEMVFRILHRMLGEDRWPNSVTLLTVLNACSHAGLANDGKIFFELLSNDEYPPSLEHYTCMLDLLGRAGQLKDAIYMVGKMRVDPDIVVWHTLFGACKKWGNVHLAEKVFNQAVQVNKIDAAAYVSLANLYADDNDQ